MAFVFGFLPDVLLRHALQVVARRAGLGYKKEYEIVESSAVNVPTTLVDGDRKSTRLNSSHRT